MAERQGKASPLALAKAVFWSFFGIRRKSDYDSDAARLTPAQVVGAGLAGAALLVTFLVLLVKFVISRAT
jgi:hypothetical protein